MDVDVDVNVDVNVDVSVGTGISIGIGIGIGWYRVCVRVYGVWSMEYGIGERGMEGKWNRKNIGNSSNMQICLKAHVPLPKKAGIYL